MFRVCFTALLTLAAVCPWGARANEKPVVSEFARKLYWQAHDLDKLEDNNPRYGMNDGYVSPFGAQVHPYCFVLAEKEGVRRKDAEAAFERAFLDSFNMLVNTCQSKYPEFAPYIGEWISQFRRSVFTCTKNNVKFSAQNLAVKIGVKWTLEDEAKANIDLGDESNGLESMPKIFKTTVVVPTASIRTFLFSYQNDGDHNGWVVDSIIHEILHSTHANNSDSLEHNESEYIKPGGRGRCGRDITTDRINVISSLCSNARLHESSNRADVDMYLRFSDCGGMNACERFFQQDSKDKDLVNSVSRYYTPEKGLSKQASQSLCARLYNEGACHYQLTQQGQQITKSNPTLEEIGNRLRARFNQIAPRSPVQIGAPIIDSVPGTREKLRELLKSSACLAKHFSESRNGSLYIVGAPPFTGDGGPSWSYSAATMALKEKGAECGSAESLQLRNVLQESLDRASQAFGATAYQKLIAKRYTHAAEDAHKPAALSLDDALGNEYMRSFIGSALYDEYLNAVSRFHFNSPDFDCKSSGLYPLDALGNFLSHVNKTKQQCGGK